jgi:signal transduction histidine kinase/DNA-binding response OmpR family regulator
MSSGRIVVSFIMFSIAGFAIFRIPDILFVEGNTSMALISLGAHCLAVLLVFLIHRYRRFLEEAFFMPLALYLIVCVSSYFMGSFLYFFPTCIGICCIDALYFNRRALLKYLIVSNSLSLVLIILGLPLRHPTRQILLYEILMQWYLCFFSSFFIYRVTAYASNKNNVAIRAQNSFHALLAVTSNMIVLVDDQYRITYYSKSFARLAKLEDSPLTIGGSIFDLIKEPEIKQLIYEIHEKSHNNCPDFFQYDRELILQDGPGSRRYYFTIISVRLTGEIKGRLITMLDVTAMMRAKLDAEAASRSKTAFLATMSHEIRTPLNAIIGLSEIELQKKLPMDIRLNVEKIRSSGSSLLSIVNDILDISKIEAGSFALVLVEYDVPSMVNDVIQLNSVRIGAKPLAFKVEIDETIPSKLFGDELRVKQVLTNLLSNAFKYTEEGIVHFTIAWERLGENARLIFTVKDTGRGIRETDIPALFSEYRQLDSQANRHIEGTGLGLSITKTLVELMGGGVTVESVYGQGSVFTAHVIQDIKDGKPIGRITARNLEQFRFRDTIQSRGLRLARSYMPYGKVLVVDDVETNLDVARGLLLPYGLGIDVAASGQDAIDKVRAVAFDSPNAQYNLILMDHMMPSMDGIEAVKNIRATIDSEYARNVPIIALTANALAGNADMFMARGFNGYISKPIDVMQLDAILNNWVRNRQPKETLLQAEMEQALRGDHEAQDASGILENLVVEGVDLGQGLDRYRTEAAYLDILRSYYVHTPGMLEKMRNPVRESLAGYMVMVHGLKGSSYGICANGIGEKAEELENAARNGNFELVETDNGSFIEMVELLLLDLGDILKKAADSREAKQKAEAPDSALLQELLEAARRYKSTAMEKVMAELESYHYETGSELIRWLREQIDNLEYEVVQNQLAKPDPLVLDGPVERDMEREGP